MEGETKAISAFFVLVLLVILGILGLAAWGFIELILWVTSK